LVTLAGHTARIDQATWSQDERRILTVGCDEVNIFERCTKDAVRIWDAESGQELVTVLAHSIRVNQATWSQDDSRILTTGCDEEFNGLYCKRGTARIWYTRLEDLIEQAACPRLPRNMTRNEWSRFMDGPYQEVCPEAPIPP
jgi:WD40 repeat protein